MLSGTALGDNISCVFFLFFLKNIKQVKHADCVHFTLNNDQQNELAIGHRIENCVFFSPHWLMKTLTCS